MAVLCAAISNTSYYLFIMVLILGVLLILDIFINDTDLYYRGDPCWVGWVCLVRIER